jgi:uncharacterized damage-inducible protein DinB
MSNSLTLIRQLFDYNRWANERLLVACEQLTLEQWSRELGQSWGSVHGVLTHMYAAETIWLARWKGTAPKVLGQEVEFSTFADLERAWVQLDLEVGQFVDGLEEKDLWKDVTYTNTKGITYTEPLGPLLFHSLNHCTHHRGELAVMLTSLGIAHPEDEFLVFLREKMAQGQKNGK